jgi:rifampicin phosphotransferase
LAEVLWLDEVGDDDRPRVGAKAFNLARLKRRGLPVPDGFVLTAGPGPLDGPRSDALRAAYARLGGTVAVRSSSTLEDTDEASFAGQYLTVLDVSGGDEVVGAARACLESAGAGAGYARAVGAVRPGAMAVLVQRFVPARAAGVAFTRHPQDPSAWLVESHGGRGDAVVSGAVSPDRYVGGRGGEAPRAVPEGASLGAADVARVVSLARRAEDLLGAPQDVEWALGADGLFLLQSRPITTLGPELEVRDPRIRRLTRANVGEVMPDAVTPLTWTSVVAFLEHGFQAVTAMAGVRPREASPFLVLHRQHVYLNLSLSAEVAARLPGVTDADAERLVLGEGAPGGRVRVRAAGLPVLAGVGLRLLGLARRLPGEVEACADLVRRMTASRAAHGAGAGEMTRAFERFMEAGRRVATAHIATSGASAVRLVLLGRVLSASNESRAAARVNRLLAGLDGLESAEPATALEELAVESGRAPEWAAWIRRPPDQAAADLRRGEAPAGLADRLRSFLERFGHRAVSEGELKEPAWEDDPEPVLRALQGMLDTPGPAGFGRRAARETRRIEEEALMGQTGFVMRPVVRYALAGARQGVRTREGTKSLAIALVHYGRRLARAAGARLCDDGRLARADDVFFLTLEETMATLAGGAVPRAAVERRRRAYERERGQDVPRDVDLGAPGDARAPDARAANDATLTGIGVSGGVGTGPARVLRGAEGARIERGEVLVAPVLDAAYGPLLALASGAVAEVGGLLSHGSVVARELGVPCVVDAAGATRRIATGDRVAVDGDSGRVTLLGDRAGDAAAADGVVEPDAGDEAGPHPLEDHPFARESVYFNVQDPASGVVVVSSLGRRPGGDGEALLAVGLPDGRVLFGLDRGPARTAPGLAVGGLEAGWDPVALRARMRLSPHERAAFPLAPVPLLLAPRTVTVGMDLAFVPSTPAVDLCAGLPDDVLLSLRPLGAHHVEQSGAWQGTVTVDGTVFPISGGGSRDHSWGLRDWDAADHWRLFTVRLGPDLAVHALAVSVRGRLVEGGFVWRDGRLERVTRVRCAAERDGDALHSFELEVATAGGPPLRLAGRVWRSVTVPVQVERRPWRHLAGRPYRLLLQENFTRYEAAGRTGYGMAEITRRPS